MKNRRAKAWRFSFFRGKMLFRLLLGYQLADLRPKLCRNHVAASLTSHSPNKFDSLERSTPAPGYPSGNEVDCSRGTHVKFDSIFCSDRLLPPDYAVALIAVVLRPLVSLKDGHELHSTGSGSVSRSIQEIHDRSVVPQNRQNDGR